jgi:hypothetical protein
MDRFQEQDEVIIDRQTGLMWTKNGSLSEFPMTWKEAFAFINVQNFYWSSTTSMYETRYAWALYMRDGAVGVGFKSLSEFYLWPVRNNPGKVTI